MRNIPTDELYKYWDERDKQRKDRAEAKRIQSKKQLDAILRDAPPTQPDPDMAPKKPRAKLIWQVREENRRR